MNVVFFFKQGLERQLNEISLQRPLSRFPKTSAQGPVHFSVRDLEIGLRETRVGRGAHGPARRVRCVFVVEAPDLEAMAGNCSEPALNFRRKRLMLSVVWWVFLLLFFFPHCVACGITASLPGIEPASSAVKAWSPHHWVTGNSVMLSGIGNFLCRLNRMHEIRGKKVK